jgi:hypothetical protein
VNICFDQHIGSQLSPPDWSEPWQWNWQPLESFGAQATRCHVHLDAIDEVGVPEGAMKKEATLDD